MNCPRCQKATEVPGGRDLLWSATVGCAALGTVILVVLAYLYGGPPMAGLTFIGCGLAAAVVRLSS